MTQPSADQIDRLTRAFERFTRRFKVAEAAAAAENALNPIDAQALMFVSDNPGCGLADVARYLGVAPTTMSSSVDRLVRRALIERHRPEANRRAVALTATDKGRAVVGGHRAAFRDASRWMLSTLDEAERALLVRLSEKIATHET